jgi:hypothetical protein
MVAVPVFPSKNTSDDPKIPMPLSVPSFLIVNWLGRMIVPPLTIPKLSIVHAPIDPVVAETFPLKIPSVALKTPSAVTLNFPLSVSIIF